MQAKGEIMSTILATLILSSVNIADAKPVYRPNRHRHHHRRSAQRVVRYTPTPPPSARHSHAVFWHRNYWAYPHTNTSFLWKWTPGHYNMMGNWIPGHWKVIVRI